MENPRNFLIFVAMMKKMILLAAAALLSVAAFAQTLSLKVPENVPEAAREVLVQRFTQMLQGAGVTVGEGGETLFIEGKVTGPGRRGPGGEHLAREGRRVRRGRCLAPRREADPPALEGRGGVHAAVEIQILTV